MPLVVNGEAVDDSVLAREAEALRQRFEQLTDEQRKEFGFQPGTLESTAVEWARENVIEQVLLKQDALADSEPLDPGAVAAACSDIEKQHGGPEKLSESGLDPSRLRDDVETRLRVDRLIERVTSKAKPPKPKEVAESYRRNKDNYRTEETVRVAHIVKNVEKGVSEQQARAAAEALYAKLQAGAVFQALADGYSDCPGNGGDLGYFGRGKMVREFENAVFELQVGQTTGVFQTVFGFHIAKLLDRRPAGLRPLSDVRGEIESEILAGRKTKLLEQHVDRLREAATIEGGEAAS